MNEIELKGLKEKIYYEKVLDKMPVYVWQNEKVKGVFCALGVRYGSIHQDFKVDGELKYHKVPSGIAHFLEHLDFYEEDNKTATDFYAEFGSEVNAFTTFDYTCYHVYTTKELKINLEHLLDFVLTPCFNKKMVNKERNIIIEELSMDKDYPETKLFFTHYADLFHKYKYSEMITGSKEDVKRTTLEDIKLVFDTFYHPENMFLVVTGNVNPYEVMKVVEDNLKSKDLGGYKKPKVKKLKEPVDVVNEVTEIEGNVENAKVKISIKTPLSNFKNIDNVKLRLMLSLILNSNFGATSDLKEELMEKELINYLGISKSLIGEYVILTISVDTKYPKDVIKEIKKQIKNLDMIQENLKRKVNANIATLVLSYDDIMEVNNILQEEILAYGTVIDNVKEHLEQITLEEIKDVIERLERDNIAVTILNPKK